MTQSAPLGVAPDYFRMPLPDLDPEPPALAKEDLLQEQTEFETILYAMAYQQPDRAKALMARYFELLPDYSGAPDDADVWAPNAAGPVDVPRHWVTTPVHMLPGGFGNPKTVRMTILGKRQYHFTRDENLAFYLGKVHGGRRPQRIMDLGCGTATTTFAYADLFPQAEVIGVDLSAPYIRFDRDWKAMRGGYENLHFYQDNAQRTSFEAESFDIVHATYVLHEMPRDDSHRILEEAWRLCRPGGTVSIMDVQCLEADDAKQARVQRGKRGEPFLAEYMRLDPPSALPALGFIDLQVHESNTDGIFLTATKPA